MDCKLIAEYCDAIKNRADWVKAAIGGGNSRLAHEHLVYLRALCDSADIEMNTFKPRIDFCNPA